ncbi:MAG: hypothetical protein HWN67_16380 [Candidatus Helarchaeota archaeon]|nr:hypothetical protein [Candidatus Helarchaeota archaeon]
MAAVNKIIRCSVCNKELKDFKPGDKKYKIYRDRIDRPLPGEKSHFKHIYVTYIFCSEACYEKFNKEWNNGIQNKFLPIP